MKYMVSTMLDGATTNEVFTDLVSAIAVFKQYCQEGRCAAIYNLA